MRSHVFRSAIAPARGYVCPACRFQIARGTAPANRRYQHNDSSQQNDRKATTSNPSLAENKEFSEPPPPTSTLENEKAGLPKPKVKTKQAKKAEPPGAEEASLAKLVENVFKNTKKAAEGLDGSTSKRSNDRKKKGSAAPKDDKKKKAQVKAKQQRKPGDKAAEPGLKTDKTRLKRFRKIPAHPPQNSFRKIHNTKAETSAMYGNPSISAPRTAGIPKDSSSKIETTSASDLDMIPLDVKQPPVPSLGLRA